LSPEQVIQLLEALATKLTPPAQYVFGLAVRQVVIDGVFAGLEALFALTLVAAFWTVWVRKVLPLIKAEREFGKTKQYSYDRPDTWQAAGFTAAAVGGMFTFFVGLVASESLHTALNYLLNPEYATLMRLADLIK
jgi:hypothetical protein